MMSLPRWNNRNNGTANFGRMCFVTRVVRLLAGCAFLAHAAMGQDLGDYLHQLNRTNGERYVTPLIDAWGAGFNSGFFHSADLHDILGLDIHLKLSLAGIRDDQRTYRYRTPETINVQGRIYRVGSDYPYDVEANTVVGGKEQTVVRSAAGVELMTIPGGFNLDVAPLVVPQVSLGLPFGIEVTGRFIPTTRIVDVGKMNLLGFGIRHDLDQYVPFLPVDIAAHFFTQKLNILNGSNATLLSVQATAYGLEASKNLLLFTVYGGFQLESSSWTIGSYEASVHVGSETHRIPVEGFSLESRTKSRSLVGIRTKLLFLNVHADYTFAETNVLTIGVGISIQ